MHEIVEVNGRVPMAYTGESPWHALGTSLDESATLDAWRDAAGFNWEAVKRPVMYATGDDDSVLREVPGQNVLMRSDNLQPLSIVSNRYEPVQPGDLLHFFQRVVEELGGFRMSTMGQLRGGKKIWGLAESTESFISLGDREDIKRYLLLASSFDFSLPTIVQQTGVRVVCSNTLNAAFNAGDRGADPQLRVKHVTDFNYEKAREHMALDETWASFGANLDRLASKRVKAKVVDQFFLDVFYPVKEDEKREEITKAQQRRIDELSVVLSSAPGQDTKAASGTLWGALNAVTYYVDHSSRARSAEYRLERAWFGEGASLKNRAGSLALQLA